MPFNCAIVYKIHALLVLTLVDISENVSKVMRFYLFLQSIEVINDDSNKQVQGEERTDNYEHDEIEIRNKTVFPFRLSVNLKKKRENSYNKRLRYYLL